MIKKILELNEINPETSEEIKILSIILLRQIETGRGEIFETLFNSSNEEIISELEPEWIERIKNTYKTPNEKREYFLCNEYHDSMFKEAQREFEKHTIYDYNELYKLIYKKEYEYKYLSENYEKYKKAIKGAKFQPKDEGKREGASGLKTIRIVPTN